MAYVTLTFAKMSKCPNLLFGFPVAVCRGQPRTFMMWDVREPLQYLLFGRPWPTFATVTHIWIMDCCCLRHIPRSFACRLLQCLSSLYCKEMLFSATNNRPKLLVKLDVILHGSWILVNYHETENHEETQLFDCVGCTASANTAIQWLCPKRTNQSVWLRIRPSS